MTAPHPRLADALDLSDGDAASAPADTPPPAPRGHVPDDDAPRLVMLRHRADGWTPERQRGFLELLADTGSVTQAALRVGMSRESAYRLRRRADATAFAEAWDAAIAAGVRRLADACLERAIEGVRHPVFHRGDQVGERIVHSDALAMFMLRHHDPLRYGNLSGARPYDARTLDTHQPRLRRLPLLLNRLLRRGRHVDVSSAYGV